MVQNLIILFVVLAAGVYILKKYWNKARQASRGGGPSCGCGSGCEGCSQENGSGKSDCGPENRITSE